MKKWIVTLVGALLISLSGVVCMAEDEPDILKYRYFEYYLNEDETVTICGLCDEESEMIIPTEIDGKPVAIIEDGAFKYSKVMTSITIPESVTLIKGNPFLECEKLREIHVSPDNMNYAVIDNVLFEKNEKRLICYPCGLFVVQYTIPDGIEIIGNDAFNHCTNLTEIKIPDSVTMIEADAFRGCYNLEKINIPSSITTICKETFFGCGGLESIEIPNSVTEIEEGAFSYCDRLTRIDLPEAVMRIGKNPFWNCANLKEIVISPDNDYYSVIDNVLIEKSGQSIVCYPKGLIDEDYIVPDGIIAIGDQAFSGCSSLYSIIIPETVKTIGDHAFNECHNLVFVELPDSVSSIGGFAFSYCKHLQEIKIPNSVTTIEAGAFYDCTGLESVEIPDSVVSFGKLVFSGCENMVLTVARDSFGEQYAEENNIPYVYPDTNDWLNS